MSSDEIKEIEEVDPIKLPAVYRMFLLAMGKRAGHYMLGSTCFHDDLWLMRRGAEGLMEENSQPPLPWNAFVFWMHQGYRVAYFLLDEGDDPPVYYYTEEQEEVGFNKITNTLTDFFILQLASSYSEDQFELPLTP